MMDGGGGIGIYGGWTEKLFSPFYCLVTYWFILFIV
jgi:hypothetical protein